MISHIEVLRDHFRWFYGMQPLIHPFGNTKYVRRAMREVESLFAASKPLRPLRWYTDARDGLCPDAQ